MLSQKPSHVKELTGLFVNLVGLHKVRPAAGIFELRQRSLSKVCVLQAAQADLQPIGVVESVGRDQRGYVCLACRVTFPDGSPFPKLNTRGHHISLFDAGHGLADVVVEEVGAALGKLPVTNSAAALASRRGIFAPSASHMCVCVRSGLFPDRLPEWS